MTKATYTSEEVQHMLESLFHEKKKAKKLQTELNLLSQERDTLQNEVKSFKSSKDQVDSAHFKSFAEIENLQKILEKKEKELAQAHIELLKKHQRLASAQAQTTNHDKDPEDTASLTEQVHKLKELTLNFKKKYQETLSSLEATRAQFADQDKKIQDLIHKNQELHNSQAKQSQLLQSLESQRSLALRDANLAKQQYTEIQVSLKQTQEEWESLKLAFEDQEADNVSLISQQNTLKQAHQENQRLLAEAEKEIRTAHQKAVSFKEKIAQISHENHRLQAQQNELLENLEDAQEVAEMQKQRIDQLTAVIMDKDNKIGELFQFELSFKQLLEQHQALDATLHEEILRSQTISSKKEEAEKQITELRQHADHLDKAIQYLRIKSEEARQEADQLGTELASYQDLNDQLSKNLRLNAERLSLLEVELEQERQHRSSAQQQSSHLQQQSEQLNMLLSEKERNLVSKAAELNSTKANLSAMQMDNRSLEQKISLREGQVREVGSEIDVIKQTLVKGIRETKELEARYYEVAQEKAGLIHDNQHLKREIEEVRAESAQHINRAQEFQRQQEAFQSKIAEWETKVYQAKQLEEERQQILVEKDQKVATLSQELQTNLEKIKTLQGIQADRDAQIQMAQQHLAKKVKDNTILNEKIEEQRNQITELQSHAQTHQTKIAEYKTALETHQQQESKLQDLLNESKRAAELQAQKWEEKYLKLYEKWAETESTNKELKKLEEKYAQMQALFANFNHMLGASNPPAQKPVSHTPLPQPMILRQTTELDPTERMHVVPPDRLKEEHIPGSQLHPQNDDLLSHVQQTQSRYKHNLFE